MTIPRVCLGVFAAMAIAATTWAQIPNSGFESWTLTVPDGWVTSNAAPIYTNVTKSTTAHTGLAAIRGDAVQFSIVVMAPTIQSGPGGHGFAYAQRPTAITGWYQFNSAGGDRFGVNVGLFKGGDTGTLVALAASADPTTQSAYTQFSVPFNYLMTWHSRVQPAWKSPMKVLSASSSTRTSPTLSTLRRPSATACPIVRM